MTVLICRKNTCNAAMYRASLCRLLRRFRLGRLSAESRHYMSEMGVYPANLCPLSSGVEFASLGKDFGQSIGEPIKAASGRAVWQGSPKHFDGVLGEQ